VNGTHYLEMWSDARAFDGTASIVQPLIAPLYGGKSVHEFVEAINEKPEANGFDVVRAYWQGQMGGANFETAWRKALHDGFIAGTAFTPRTMNAGAGAAAQASNWDANAMEIIFRRDPTIYDGSFANNGWLQETPKPMTQITWDNPVLISLATGKKLGLKSEDVVEIDYQGRKQTGAIWLQPILQTPPKRFDLLLGVNVRAAYAACYYALPHMIKQQWGHVLNMCPRLGCEPSPGKVAYDISKLGMARLALGIAAEHAKDNVAANTLWPRTIIESQASINWKMADRSQWRTPEILCDAACAIFAREPRTCTGRQWIDEQVLTELAGVTDFDGYWCEGKPPAEPIYIDKW
jgi:hypothetical protein